MAHAKRIAAAAAAVVVIVAAAWAFDAWVSRVPGAGGPGRTYRIAIVRDGRTSRYFTIAEMDRLGVRTVNMQGKDEIGTPLLSVLKAAGVSEFKSVAVHGMGVRDSGYLWLAGKQISRDILLSAAKRGTAKMCGPDIPKEDRVRDVTKVEVDAPRRPGGSQKE